MYDAFFCSCSLVGVIFEGARTLEGPRARVTKNGRVDEANGGGVEKKTRVGVSSGCEGGEEEQRNAAPRELARERETRDAVKITIRHICLLDGLSAYFKRGSLRLPALVCTVKAALL